MPQRQTCMYVSKVSLCLDQLSTKGRTPHACNIHHREPKHQDNIEDSRAEGEKNKQRSDDIIGAPGPNCA